MPEDQKLEDQQAEDKDMYGVQDQPVEHQGSTSGMAQEAVAHEEPMPQPAAAFQPTSQAQQSDYTNQQPAYAPVQDPGNALAIISIVMIFVFPLIGLILGIMARNKSKKVGIDNSMALVGIIINSILIAIGALFFMFWFFLVIVAVSSGS